MRGIRLCDGIEKKADGNQDGAEVQIHILTADKILADNQAMAQSRHGKAMGTGDAPQYFRLIFRDKMSRQRKGQTKQKEAPEQKNCFINIVMVLAVVSSEDMQDERNRNQAVQYTYLFFSLYQPQDAPGPEHGV